MAGAFGPFVLGGEIGMKVGLSYVVSMLHRVTAQGLVEYGLIIALVAVVAIAGLIIFGPAVSDLLSQISDSV